jgi:hypothetical protein
MSRWAVSFYTGQVRALVIGSLDNRKTHKGGIEG